MYAILTEFFKLYIHSRVASFKFALPIYNWKMEINHSTRKSETKVKISGLWG